MENLMKTIGEDKVISKTKTRFGATKTFKNLAKGISIIGDEAIELTSIFEETKANFTGKTKPVWWKYTEEWVDNDGKKVLIRSTIDTITSVLMIIASKVSLDRESGGNMHYLTGAIEKNLDVEYRDAYRMLIWVLVKCSIFEVKVIVKNKKTYKRAILTEAVTDDIQNDINTKVHFAFYPMPMTEEPTEWKAGVMGGYKTRRTSVVRARKEITTLPQFAFDALNAVQGTAWKINREVYEQVKSDTECPEIEDYIANPWVETGDKAKNATANKNYFQQIKRYKKARSKYESTKIALDIAERYLDEDKIYFPHNFDYRGRMYPIPVVLNPQGDDKVKGLLEFAEGHKLTEDGAKWSYAYLASLYGHDKKSFDERVELGLELVYADYKEADEPYQFLSLQYELQAYDADSNYEVKAHIHIDGACNAVQHASALTGCEKGMKASNVLPSEGRRDIYSEIAAEALESTTDEFHTKILSENGRKLAKVPVMVTQYGGKTITFARGIHETIQDLYGNIDIPEKSAYRLAQLIESKMGDHLPGTKLFKTWIQAEGKRIAKTNSTVAWTTPDAFPVTMAPKKLDPTVKKVEVKLDGKLYKLNLKVELDEINEVAVSNAISPNFIHSMDAAHMRMTINQLPANNQWAMIHDSFGSHPNNMTELLKHTKEQFVRLYSCNPIHGLAIDLGASEYPSIGTPDLTEIINSEYFFS